MLLGLVTVRTFFLLFNLLDCGNSFVETIGRNFTRQTEFDDYECTSVNVIHLGISRSKLECSEACAKVTQCLSFFYNTGDYTCKGSTVIHQNIHACVFKMGTIYYIGEGPFSCDTGWEEYGGHCYIHNTQALIWQDAQTHCQDLGGYLLSIETEQESQAMIDTFTEGGFWIGGNDDYADSAWRWESGDFLTYTNWDDGEPSSTYSHSDCMRVRNNWLWHDMDCGLPYESICEKEPAA